MKRPSGKRRVQCLTRVRWSMKPLARSSPGPSHAGCRRGWSALLRPVYRLRRTAGRYSVAVLYKKPKAGTPRRRVYRAKRAKHPETTAAALFTAALLACSGTAAASSLASGPTSAANPFTGQQLNSSSSLAWWQHFLKSCKNLGRSRAPSASVILNMEAEANPAVLERWATAHRLQLQWYVGHAVAVLAAAPASLGAALDVRID